MRAVHVAVAIAVLSGGIAPATAAQAAVPTVVVDAATLGGPLRKAGLGSLLGVTGRTTDTPADLLGQTHLTVSQHMTARWNEGERAGTEIVAPKARGAGVKMIARFNDLMGGNPWYQWQGTAHWFERVDEATRRIQPYRDTLLAVAPFNEPDNKLHGLANDTAVPGAGYDQKFNWLWTQTVRRIRAIDASVPVIGPNWEFYLPWQGGQQQKMRDFLRNAIDTGTVPQLIGWHNLGPSPGDVPEALTRYYRPLENELGVPGRPLRVVVEEYGPQSNDPGNAGNFEGVPGTMIQYWADLERYDVDFGALAIYTNPGLLGNTLRRVGGGALQPNGGFWMMKWYKDMRGAKVPVNRWNDTANGRRYLGVDGLASWDGAALTVLAGGEDGPVDLRVTGLAARGLQGQVRVRVDSTVWDKDPAEANRRVDSGGDPKQGTYNVLDKSMTVDGSGTLTVPLRRMNRYDGYRITIGRAGPPDVYPTKHEAENATVTAAVRHGGANGLPASAGGYVGGIDHPDSAVTFAVDAPSAGIYAMTVRYAAGVGTASHQVAVNGRPQGEVGYPATAGWAPSELDTTVKRIALGAGRNEIRLSKGVGYAEVDYVDVRPDTHRYEAENAAVTSARLAPYWSNYIPDYVAGLDQNGSQVEFTVDAPVGGTYVLEVGYGNGTPSTSDHSVLVNGTERAVVSYPPSGSWLDSQSHDRATKVTSVRVPLNTGANKVVLRKRTGFAELDWLAVRLP
ncbi:CBM35 domain-containing protein [Lentzea sp. NPDC058450]|uniref:CBM35 domain-containing protein n=1 Tax=Lentzea sp. NPDC058450 TaxID=3346505 RepID=UPI003668D21E